MAGRIAINRSGSVISEAKVQASRTVTPRGTIDRSGGGAGGSGGAAGGGILLGLSSHPGFTLSASVRVDSNIPIRTGILISEKTTSASRATQRDRSGSVVSPVVASGARVSSGNRNRNGLIVSTADASASWVQSSIRTRSAGIEVAITNSATFTKSATTTSERAGLVASSIVLSGSYTRSAYVIVRPRRALTSVGV